jgi:hypothetical protein
MCSIYVRTNTVGNIKGEYRNHANTYMPCNPWSNYHDLTCGHRIESLDDHMCGSSCVNGGQCDPFICKQGIIEDVEIGLGIRAEDEPIEHNGLLLEYPVALVDPHSRTGSRVQEVLEDMSYTQFYRDSYPVPTFDCVAVFLLLFPEAWKEDPQIHEMTQGLQDMTFSMDLTDMKNVLHEMK